MCAGKKVKLSLAAEEVALFFAQMLDHEYTTKTVFRENFFKDWRKVKQESVRSCPFWKKKKTSPTDTHKVTPASQRFTSTIVIHI